MKISRAIFVAIVVAALSSCTNPETQSSNGPENDPVADKAAVESVIEQYINAANANDPDVLLSFVCHDAEVIPPGQAPVNGAGVHQFYRSFFESSHFAFESNTTELVVSGDWAFRRYAYDLTLTPKDGSDVVSMKGYGIHMFRQGGDGDWCVVKDMYNTISAQSEG